MNPKNTNKRVKPVTKTLPLVVTGKDQNGYDYDADSALDIVADLQSSDVFEKLSVMATIAKSVVLNKEDVRGVMNVARITSYNPETKEMDLLFFGKNTETAPKVEDMVVVPRVRLGRDTDKVATVLSFEIVNAMEA